MSTPSDDSSEFVALPAPADVEPAWYEVYLRAARVDLSPAVSRSLLIGVVLLAATVLLLTGGDSAVINTAIAGVVGLTFGALTYLRGSGPEIGISLGPATVGFGRRGPQLHHWPRSALRSVRLNGPYAGEQVEPAIAQYLIPGMPYLTLNRVDGVTAHVALDPGHAYSGIIEDVLVHGRPLTELSHPPVRPSRTSSSGSTWEREGVDPSVTPRPGPAPTAPTISAGPARTTGTDAPRVSPATAAPGPAGAGSAEPDEILWRRATQRHDAVLLSYAPYEVDPHMVMRYPAITDVSCPSTATFVEALGDASTLRTADYPFSTSLSRAYRDAVGTLEVAWSAAERYARNVELDLLQPEDRKRLLHARKLLAHAEGAASDAERATYFHQVKVLMDDLARRGAIVEPAQVRLAIATKVAQAITATDQAG